MDLKEFIKKSLKQHGKKYDYSKSEHNGCKEKIEIICLKHGSFFVLPTAHINGAGCKECSYDRKRQLFVKRARIIHKNKYNYEKSIYKNTEIKLTIICPIHGNFEQSPYSHLAGHGCPKCSYNLRANNLKHTQEYVDKICLKYKIKNCSEYKGANKHLTLECLICNTVWRQVFYHIQNGHGCPKCASVKRGLKNRKKHDDYIKEINLIHGDKYDYSQTIYETSSSYITIVCKKHGPFQQNATAHLSGQGCQKCYNDKRVLGDENFKKKARKLHGNKYDYSFVDYKDSELPVIIICKIHGMFSQVPHNHLKGAGCQKCRNKTEHKIREIFESKLGRKFEKIRPDWLKNPETGSNLELDGYNDQLKLAFEYNGIHHYEDVLWRLDTFKKRKKYDSIKRKLCVKQKVKLITVPYYIKEPEKYIVKKLVKLGFL